MGSNRSKSRFVYAVPVILTFFMLIALLSNCAHLARDDAQYDSMTLSSGEDYIGDRGSGAAGSDAGWEMKRRAESSTGKSAHAPSESLASPAADPQPAGGSGSSIVTGALASVGLDEKLESWFLPQAYAQDHGVDERYLVRTGDCSVQVEDYKTAADDVAAVAHKYDGLISGSHSSRRGDNSVTGWITVRIPAENFFDAWNDVLAVGEVMEESVSTEDVSQQYVGYISRLKNLLAEQAVLQKMLDEALEVQRKRGLGEGYSILLDTQDRLFKVTGEIESTEDRINALADRITRSTITVNISEAKKLPEQVKEEFSWGFGETAGRAYKDLMLTLRNTGQGLIYFLITCWTWLIPWAFFIWLGAWIYKRFIAPRLKADETKDKPAVEGAKDPTGQDSGEE